MLTRLDLEKIKMFLEYVKKIQSTKPEIAFGQTLDNLIYKIEQELLHE